MAIYKGREILYKGAVIDKREHFWADGMLSEYAIVWDAAEHRVKEIEVGYYGIDGTNLAGMRAEIDVNEETARDFLKHLKVAAVYSFCRSVTCKKQKIEKGIQAEVIRGRKIPKGTILDVFWVGERPTYTGYGTELIAGGKDKEGKKVWIKADYLKNISPIKSPTPDERKKYIKWYMRMNAGSKVLQAAKGVDK